MDGRAREGENAITIQARIIDASLGALDILDGEGRVVSLHDRYSYNEPPIRLFYLHNEHFGLLSN